MKKARKIMWTELQRPRVFLLKALIACLIIFCIILWTEHQTLSSSFKSTPSFGPSVSAGIQTKAENNVTLIVLAHSKHLVHTRNCLHSIDEHVSKNETLRRLINMEIMVVEVEYDFHLRSGLHKALSLCPQCTLLLTNDTKNENPTPLTTAINRGAEIATGSVIIFITDATELTETSIAPLVANFFTSDHKIGVVGGKLLAPDQTIVHGGVDFIMSRKTPRFSYGSSTTPNFPSPVKKFAGYPKTHPLSLQRKPVHAVVIDTMTVRKALFTTLHGFNPVYGDSLSYVDFCLRVEAAKRSVIYEADSISYNFEGEEGESEDDAQDSWGSDAEISAFSDVWGKQISDEIESRYQVKQLTLRWNMECGAGQTLGFTTEAIYFMLGLEGKVDLKIEVNNPSQCKTELQKAGLPKWVVRSVVRLINKYVSPNNKNILVIHRDPGRYNYFVSRADDPVHYVVGRSMYETDRIPSDWIKPCNDSVREIWVPSHFNVETFSNSGVDRNKLFVVPEPIDIITYDPDVTEPLLLKDKKAFSFLAVMKWEKRKGWDTLLRAYLTEFSADDSVSLFIRSNMDAKNRQIFEDFVTNTTKELLRANPKKTFPQIPQTEDALLPYLPILLN